MKLFYLLTVEPSTTGSGLEAMLASLPPEKREKLNRFRFDIDRKIGLYSELLTRCLICMRSGLQFNDIIIKTNEAGKPYLASFPYYEYNISHTRNAVAVALSDAPIGIDIERIRDIDINIAHDIFTDNELAYLFSKENDYKQRFFTLWTKKEALIKYGGKGLPSNLKSFDVTESLPATSISTITADEYVISICSDKKFCEKDLIKITEAELAEMWRDYAF